MKRRTFLLGSLGMPMMRAAQASAAPRIVVLDWGLAETLLALGVTPLGAAEISGYDANVVAPLMPHAVTDVGLRLAPSLELLASLKPHCIVINSSQESQRPMLERIAPVHAFAVYTDAGAPYRRAQNVTLELGALCGCAAAARDLIAHADATLADDRAQLARWRIDDGHPRYLIRFFDAKHIGIYGARSLFQDVLDALGVRNAWHGATDYWGIGVTGLQALASTQDAGMLVFDPLPAGVSRALDASRLWHALPSVQAGRVNALPPFWGFGMLPTAMRFSHALTDALLS
jgi:ferric hydroxamate transport system substrate-binding protein